MANTRFNYDPCRTVKKLQESTDVGRYMLNTPGNGMMPTFLADPHIIPQKWGGNLMNHPTSIETTLFNINNTLRKGDTQQYPNTLSIYQSDYVQYPIDNVQITNESRYITPAWEIRNIPIERWDYLHFNPIQKDISEVNLNIDTRNSVKDYYLYKV